VRTATGGRFCAGISASGGVMVEQQQSVGGTGGQSVMDVGPLVQLHLAPSRMLWRIGPAWAVVAGAVAAGAARGSAASLLRLAAAVILGDLLWGILRQIIPAMPGTEGTANLMVPSLPYGHGDAPLARFMQTIALGQHASTTPWLSWLGGLTLTAVLSLLLGAPVLLLSALVVGLILLTRALFRRGRWPALCLAILDVALPWILGAALVWPGVAGEVWSWLVQVAMLAAAFTVLQWGLYRARFSAGRRLVGLWLGQTLLLGMLIVLRQPWGVAVAALLLAPPAWWLARRGEAETALVRGLPWWWAAMLSVAVIVR
jgi:hypothetical protein